MKILECVIIHFSTSRLLNDKNDVEKIASIAFAQTTDDLFMTEGKSVH